MKVPTHSVVFDYDVLFKAVTDAQKAYPNETGMLLRGRKVPRRKHVYEVVGWYMPEAEADRNNWSWYLADHYKAIIFAAKQESSLIGMSHAHPYDFQYLLGAAQSKEDGELQADHKFDLSLVVTLWPKNGELHWWLACWVLGLSYPITVYIKKGKQVKKLLDFCYSAKNAPWCHAVWQGEA